MGNKLIRPLSLAAGICGMNGGFMLMESYAQEAYPSLPLGSEAILKNIARDAFQSAATMFGQNPAHHRAAVISALSAVFATVMTGFALWNSTDQTPLNALRKARGTNPYKPR